MERVGALLAKHGFILRSGGASGADSAFERGCDSEEGKKEIFIPWSGFNKRRANDPGIIIPELSRSVEMAKMFHPAWENCSSGAKKLHARNCNQVLGEDLNHPAAFVVCWHDGRGGTLQACRIAEYHGISVYNIREREGRKRLRVLINEVSKNEL